jgi:TRAP-type mannitol/chloroaromatic compound transport system permease large subunit
VPPVFLILAVLGTIFSGIAPPTEAAAVGCLASLVLAVSYRKFNFGLLQHASLETLRVSAFVVLIAALCFNPLWAGMMICINLQMAFQTAPMAMSIFVLKGAAPEDLGLTMSDIMKGVIPFVVIIMFVLFLCTIFPGIITWLPEKMIGPAH